MRISPVHQSQNTCKVNFEIDENEDDETKAKKLFNRGIEMEKSGKLYEAIQFYKKAVQIVPDVEFKLDVKPKIKERQISEYGMLYFVTFPKFLISYQPVFNLSELLKSVCQHGL